jgi:hypothetical protein
LLVRIKSLLFYSLNYMLGTPNNTKPIPQAIDAFFIIGGSPQPDMRFDIVDMVVWTNETQTDLGVPNEHWAFARQRPKCGDLTAAQWRSVSRRTCV